jgi:hypothetical protein
MASPRWSTPTTDCVGSGNRETGRLPDTARRPQRVSARPSQILPCLVVQSGCWRGRPCHGQSALRWSPMGISTATQQRPTGQQPTGTTQSSPRRSRRARSCLRRTAERSSRRSRPPWASTMSHPRRLRHLTPEAARRVTGRPSGWSARRLDRRHESPKVVMTQRAASTHGPDREEPDVAL